MGNVMTRSDGEDKLQKAQVRVKIAAGIRMFFMLLTLLLILFVFFCNKIAMGTGWYPAIRPVIYNVLAASAVIMLLAIAAKMFLAAKYQQALSGDK